jgi:arylsulfatase A-like enzyme
VFVADTDLYTDYTLNEDGVERHYGTADADYSTDVLRDRTTQFIRTHKDRPFFVVYAPAAPHGPSTPAARHAGRFADLPPFRPRSWAEKPISDKPHYWEVQSKSWIASGAPQVERSDAFRRAQLGSLLAVDEAVGAILDTLDATGLRDDTIVIFTSDNGVTWGEHWMQGGLKRCPYEECIRVPLVIRDPAASPYRDERHIALNIDLGPTIAAAAGAVLPNADGASLLPLVRGTRRERHRAPWRKDFLLEGWQFDPNDPPTHVGLRNDRWKYIRSDDPTGTKEEVYRLRHDQWELEGDPSRVNATRVQALRDRVQQLLQ